MNAFVHLDLAAVQYWFLLMTGEESTPSVEYIMEIERTAKTPSRSISKALAFELND